MTVPVVSESRARLPWRQQITARLATAAARGLILMPPRRLRQVLQLVRWGSRPATAQQACAARLATTTVSARCAGQGCLQRSVATVLLCRLHGTWADWCTGFRTQPFRAHAWVEADGVPIGEPDGMELFQTILSVRHRGRGGA
jgi:hypothetical protein